MRDFVPGRLSAALLAAFLTSSCGTNGFPPEGPEAGTPGEASAQESRALETEGVEGRVAGLLADMGRALGAADTFRFQAEVTEVEFLPSGQAVDVSRTARVAVRRPDGLFVERRADDSLRRLWFDRGRAALLDVDRDLYALKEGLPGDIDGFLDVLIERLGVAIPMADLLTADPEAAFGEFADAGVYMGMRTVRGVSCHHLAFANEWLQWQIWVASEGPPVPRKVVILHVSEPGTPRFEAHLSDWDLETRVSDTTFVFSPPEGAVRIEIEERLKERE